MADRILKPDSGNDLVLQNDDGSGKIEINENASIPVTGTLDVSGATLTTSSAQKQAIVQAGPGSGTLDVSSGTFTTSLAQKQAIVQAGPGSGTLDVSSGTFTSSTAQKDAIVDGSTAISRSGNNLTFAGTVGNTGDNTITSGNLVIGTNGKGINFSANTDDEGGAGSIATNGEILTDYEHGSWNPVLSDGSSDGDHTMHSDTAGTYTKIGDVVFLQGMVRNGDLSGNTITSSNAASIKGLPFAVGSGTNHRGGIAVGYYNLNGLDDGGGVMGAFWEGQSYIQLYESGATSGGTLTCHDFHGGGQGFYVMFSATYHTD